MAFLSAASGIISGILGAVGAVVSGVAAKNAADQQADNELASARAAEYQAQIARNNAAVSDQNASRAVAVSQIEQIEQDRESRALVGEQLAAQGASGLSLGGRSAMLTRRSAKMLGRKDALNIRYAGDVDRYNYQVEASNQRAGGELKTMEASSYRTSAEASRRAGGIAMLSGFLNAAGSLVGSASNFSFNKNRTSKTAATPYAAPRIFA